MKAFSNTSWCWFMPISSIACAPISLLCVTHARTHWCKVGRHKSGTYTYTYTTRCPCWLLLPKGLPTDLLSFLHCTMAHNHPQYSVKPFTELSKYCLETTSWYLTSDWLWRQAVSAVENCTPFLKRFLDNCCSWFVKNMSLPEGWKLAKWPACNSTAISHPASYLSIHHFY